MAKWPSYAIEVTDDITVLQNDDFNYRYPLTNADESLGDPTQYEIVGELRDANNQVQYTFGTEAPHSNITAIAPSGGNPGYLDFDVHRDEVTWPVDKYTMQLQFYDPIEDLRKTYIVFTNWHVVADKTIL